MKQANVLIYDDSARRFRARLIDFGYSTLYIAESPNNSVTLPQSRPWNAPEHFLSGEFTISQAKFMDIYSFGLLCLWTLFHEQLSDAYYWAEQQGCISFLHPLKENNRIEDAKSLNKMPLLATSLVKSLTEYSNVNANDLVRFFEAILQAKPSSCCSCLQSVLPLLGLQRSV